MTDFIDKLTLILEDERRLGALAHELVGSPEDIEDALQSALLSGYDEPPRHPLAYLRRTVRNHLHNLRRSSRRREDRERHAAQEEQLPSAATMVEREELRRRVGQAVVRLEEPYRTTIWLRFFDGCATGDIARDLQVPVATIRTRLQRGLGKLRSQLDTDYGDRSAWTALMLPWLGLGSLKPIRNAATIMTATLGTLTMKYTVSLGLVALLIAGYWLLPSADLSTQSPDPEASSSPSRRSASVPEPAKRQAVDLAQRTKSDLLSDPIFTAALCRFHGRVIDADGVGVPDITVRIRRRHPDISLNTHDVNGANLVAFDVGEACTDAQGRFLVDKIWPSGLTYNIELVDRHGRADTLATKTNPGPGETGGLGDLLWSMGSSIEGHITLANKGDASAISVRLQQGGHVRGWKISKQGVRRAQESVSGWARGEEFERLVSVQTDGSFSVRGLAPGKLSLVIYRDGEYPAYWWDGKLRPGQHLDLGSLTLATGKISGQVTDELGRPVIDAEILAADHSYPKKITTGMASARGLRPVRDDQRGIPVGRTDANGRFEVSGFSAQEVRVAIRRGPGQVWNVFPDLSCDRTHDLRLPRGYALELSARDDHGAPLDTDTDWLIVPRSWLGDRFGLPLLCPPTDRELLLEGWIEYLGAGRWRVPHMPRGDYSVAAHHPRVGTTQPHFVRLTKDHSEPFDFHLRQRLQVTVCDLAGVPIANARVVTRGDVTVKLWGLTDATGKMDAYALSRHRPYRLEISHPAFEVSRQDVAPDTKKVKVHLGRSARVRGSVVVRGATFDPIRFGIGLRKPGMKGAIKLPFDARQAFEISRLEPGRYEVALTGIKERLHWQIKPAWLQIDEGLQEDKLLTISRRSDVELPGTVSGTVKLRGSQRRFTVSLSVNGATYINGTQPGDGSFDFGEVSAGHHTLQVGSSNILLQQQVEVRSGKASTLNLEIRLGKVSGSILEYTPPPKSLDKRTILRTQNSLHLRLLRTGSITPLAIGAPDRFGRFEIEAAYGLYSLTVGHFEASSNVYVTHGGIDKLRVDGSDSSQNLMLALSQPVPVHWTVPAAIMLELQGETGKAIWFFGPSCGQIMLDENGVAADHRTVTPGTYQLYLVTDSSTSLLYSGLSAWSKKQAQLRYEASAFVVSPSGSRQELALSRCIR